MERNWGGVGIVGARFSDWVLLMLGLAMVGVMVPIDPDEVVLEVGAADVVTFIEIIGNPEEGAAVAVPGFVEFGLDDGNPLDNALGLVCGIVILTLIDGDPLG